MATVKTTIPDPRLKDIMARREDENPTIRTLVTKWWELAKLEQEAEEKKERLKQQLEDTHLRVIQFIGGRKALEELLLMVTFVEDEPKAIPPVPLKVGSRPEEIDTLKNPRGA